MLIRILILLFIVSCEPNNPYIQQLPTNTLYSAFSERPKHLDPARSYSSSEWGFTAQIYEPPLQYHYLKRPYTLEPLLVTQLPTVEFDAKNNISTYTIHIKQGVYFQPHPAFAEQNHNLTEQQVLTYQQLSDFTYTGTRELVADDFIYQIKRLADPRLNSPIFGFLSKYIVGLSQLRAKLQQDDNVDLTQVELSGVTKLSKYSYTITINGNYPQFVYWLATPFFAPIPFEADLFYQQPGMEEHNISLDWYPVGTGPFMLTENNPERRMVLVKNPNFHGETYPAEGMPEDEMHDAGKPLPFIERAVFSLEKEDIPYWNKFLQGYYDRSGISSDSFTSAIDILPGGSMQLTDELQAKGINLQISTAPTTMYWAFNMLDPIVGGYSNEQQKLRQAISIAVDVEEFINIFLNGRGTAANGPIPPGIIGFTNKSNSYVYTDDKRKTISTAKQLLIEAGYANGINPRTKLPLVINFEAISNGDPNEKSIFAWLTKQLAKINIQLNIRVTDYNRFRDKMQNGQGQMFFWGWNADYPDPENFLFMLYGPNSKVNHGGENAANYSNPEFDRLFVKMQSVESIVGKQEIISKMLAIIQQDAPWIWGYHPQSFSLSHSWNRELKPNNLARNTLKYAKIDYELRSRLRKSWNRPILWPILMVILLSLVFTGPAVIVCYKRRMAKARRY